MSTYNWWLGTPGAMQRLPQVTNNPVTAPRTRSRQVTATADGGSVVVSNLHAKTPFNLAWAYLSPNDSDLVDSFGDGLFGDGPFALVNPLQRNMLGFDDSTMGLRSAAPVRWVSSTFTPPTRAATGGPQNVPSGVLQWIGSAGTFAITSTTNVDVNSAPVYVPAEAVTFSVYLKAAASVSMTLQIAGYDTTGAYLSAQGVSITVGTSWQRYAITVNPGLFGAAAFVSPRIVCASTPNASLAAAQFEYGGLTDWQRGYGSPRVVIAADPGHSVQQFGYADKTLALAQV